MKLFRREASTSDEQVIDLDADDVAPAATAESTETTNHFGRPTLCPECSSRGFLDHIDLIDRIQYQHCTSCGHEWTMSENQLVY
ncbi:MAG TPA: hypothetical protein VGA13_09180 [Acidimicrobiales bacterium]|jgi:Zn ribbon nucleic-acid-binding protein